MNHLLYHGILLAQRSRLEALRDGFRRHRINADDIVMWLMILGGIVAALWLLSYLVTLQERRRGFMSPILLFLSLCKAHRLRWSERWLLWRVARAQRLRNPARLFLEPERLQAVKPGWGSRTRSGKLEGLRERLFAGLEQEQREQAVEPQKPDTRHAGTPPPPVPLSPTLDVPPWPPTPGPDASQPTADFP